MDNPNMSKWRTSAVSTPLLDAALAEAQGEIGAARKDATNPHFKNTYSTLASVVGACRAVFSRIGIARYQAAWTDDKPGVVITTRLAFAGEWVEADLRVPVDKSNAQAMGSAITYGKRYGLQAMAGVPSDDDDGNDASASPGQPTEPECVTSAVRDEVLALCDRLAVARSAPDKQVLGRVVFAAAWKAVALAPDPEAKPHNMTPAEGALVLAWLRSTAEKQARLEQQRGRERQPGDDDDHDPTDEHAP